MLYRLGQVLAKQRRFAEGEAALRRALRGLELGQGPDDDVPANMVRFRVLVDLARALDRDDRGGPPGEAVQASALKDDGGSGSQCGPSGWRSGCTARPARRWSRACCGRRTSPRAWPCTRR